MSEQSQNEFRQGVAKYAPGKPVLFSTVSYDEPRALGAATTMEQQVILVTGIAKTTPLLEFCQSKYRVIRHFQFDDHHHYTQQELDEIERCLRQQPQPCSILTTEKDMVKLIADPFAAHISRLPWFYIPIRQEFVKDGLKFDTLVLDAIKAHDRK